jgi:MFS family permease
LGLVPGCSRGAQAPLKKEIKTIKKFRLKSFFSGLLSLFVLAHFAHHLPTSLPVPLLPMIRSEFGLDYTQAGLIISAFSVTYGISQLPAGWLADRIGRRIMIAIGIVGVGICGLAVGLSHTYIMMIVFLGLMGLMGGGYHPAATPAVSSTVAPENRGSALGFHLIGGNASYFLVPLAAVAIAAAWGWRGSFITMAIPTIIFGAIFYRVMRRVPSTFNTREKTSTSDSQTLEIPGRTRRLIVFILLSSFSQAVLVSVISFIPLFLVDKFGVSAEAGGAFIAIYYSAGLWASTLGGYLSDRFGRMRMVFIACFAIGILTYFFNLAPFGLGMGALLLLTGMFNSMRMPVSESYIINNTSEKRRSTILGFYFFGNQQGAGIFTPLLGYTIDKLGFYYCYAFSAASVFIVTLVCFILLRGSRD